MIFNPSITVILKNNFWYLDRSISIDTWKSELLKHGLKGHSLADKLLKNLGGLKIQLAGHPSFNLAFIPTLDSSLMFEELKEVNDESELNFYPLGLDEDNIMIAIEEKGAIFGFLSDIVFRYGNDLESSLNCLFRIEGQIEDVGWNYDNW